MQDRDQANSVLSGSKWIAQDTDQADSAEIWSQGSEGWGETGITVVG